MFLHCSIRHDFRYFSVPVLHGQNDRQGEIVRMTKQMETAQLLARFKLQVKRALGQSVDLERLTREPSYARQRLSEIEEAAEDEDLLVMVLRMRDLLLPFMPEVAEVVPVVEVVPTPPEAANKTSEIRSYLMGARAWR